VVADIVFGAVEAVSANAAVLPLRRSRRATSVAFSLAADGGTVALLSMYDSIRIWVVQREVPNALELWGSEYSQGLWWNKQMTAQDVLARNFTQLHVSGNPLILPNVWDAASARIVASAGAPAIATTSGGVSWALGFGDGERLPRELALESVARIVRVAGVPVTADIEAGFGVTAADVAESVSEFIGVGAVGINLEDSLRPINEQIERVEAARSAADNSGVPMFINARIDTHRLPAIDDSLWLDETIQRARAYAAAGASGIFVLGSLRPATIQTLVRTLDRPVNVAFGPGTLSIRELAAAGASRISAGSSIAEAAYGSVSQAATAMLSAATTVVEPPALSYSDLNRIIG